ncbi:1-deoxy-D-xylulose-5-phosphate reductoisomerase [candidate division BRC1 bacterium HGW-BRC1-1]|nr:MAG: 1-deoxy-D-xylulose-5-phosphate reductoisomerase [candidate division BRC1 bacterium HGW-BRC1-1]
MSAKRVIVLGSTGSIGVKALQVMEDFPSRFDVVAISTNERVDLLLRQASQFKPEGVCVCSPTARDTGAEIASAVGAQFHEGEAGLTEMVARYDADIVVVATVGFVGLMPTLKAIERGITVALANKEVLVTAGDLVMAAARERGVKLLPIDSEHNALFQCLNGCGEQSVRRLILTASGGPFRGRQPETLAAVTPDEALAHPTWNMGRKISIDSATMMNKGFEMIEAAHLFGVPPERIEVVIHPQSTIHSMVEYVDGSILAQLGRTDMYLPIQNVLMWPDRVENGFEPLDFAQLGQLTFEKPDPEGFPCLAYAYEAAARGGTCPAVLNGANEVAVARFLAGEIGFLGIARSIRNALDAHTLVSDPTLEQIHEADKEGRDAAQAVAAGTLG